MANIIVLGAAGALGRQVAEQAVAVGHDVTVMVRTPTNLPASWRDKVKIEQADIARVSIGDLAARFRQFDAVINTAGLVSDGLVFVDLITHIVDSLEAIAPASRPVAWFVAGAGLLDIGDTRRRGLDLPFVKKTYWPHDLNYKTLQASTLDFRLMCPGPMVDGRPVGLDKLRVGIDRLPVETRGVVGWLPDLLLVPVFASFITQLIIPFADAAAFMLANLERGGGFSRHRVGLALPVGMRGKKQRWSAKAPEA